MLTDDCSLDAVAENAWIQGVTAEGYKQQPVEYQENTTITPRGTIVLCTLHGLLFYTPLILAFPRARCRARCTPRGSDPRERQHQCAINARRPRPQLSGWPPLARDLMGYCSRPTPTLRRHPRLHFKSPNLTISCKKCNQPPCARVPCTRTERGVVYCLICENERQIR